MKRLLLILILTFSFQSLTKADDIRDFEIEGMSIGDSLLDHMSEVEINNSILKSKYKDSSFVRVESYNNLKSYDNLTSFTLKYFEKLSPTLIPSISKSLISSALVND